MSVSKNRLRVVQAAAVALGLVALWWFVRGVGPRHSLKTYRDGPAAPHAAGRDEAVPEEPSCLSSESFQADPQPVITPAALPAAYGKARLVSCPDVFDAPDGTRRMWFKFEADAGGGVGGASLIGAQWVVDPQPAVTNARFESIGLRNPGCSTTEVVDGVARIWFPASAEGAARAIFSATSADGRTWTLGGPEPVLRPNVRWMRGALWSPSLTRTEDGLRMYLRCGDRTRSTLCVATSTGGGPWDLRSAPAARLPGLRADEVVGAPQVVQEGGTWHLWFDYKWSPLGGSLGRPGSGEEVDMRSAIGHVAGDGPDLFDLRGASALVVPGAVPWASKVVDSPDVVREGERIVLYFRGAAGHAAAGSAIGRAFAVCEGAPPAVALAEVPGLADPDPEAEAARWAWVRALRAATRRGGTPAGEGPAGPR